MKRYLFPRLGYDRQGMMPVVGQHGAGASEDEAVFDENLKQLATAKASS